MSVVGTLAFTFIGKDTELNLVLTCSLYTSDDPLYTAEFILCHTGLNTKPLVLCCYPYYLFMTFTFLSNHRLFF